MNKFKKITELYFNKAILITNSKDIYYLTGADFDGFWLLLYNKKIFAVTSNMVKGQVLKHFNKSVEIVVSNLFSDGIVEICKKNKIKEVGLDVSNTYVLTFDAICKKLKKNNVKVFKVSQITKDLRSIKSEQELVNIKIACDIVSKVYKEIKNTIKPAMTELDIYFEIIKLFAKYKVEPSFKTIVASGPNSANPHHISNNRKILKNDIILIDMGCMYKGYCSDLTRVVFLGKINVRTKKIWTLVKDAHDVSLKTVKNGQRCNFIDESARLVIKNAGFADNFIHGTGHGVGLDIHEYPSLSQKSKDVLREKMVITIEPGIYFNGKFGIRIEDTVLVTKNGYKVLTGAQY
ncbi:MAG: aminopeptidase P family protein [Endomicrobiaceae bacterium]|nr:aminopeptidase P family protein [Endomicrobiaceae bacterium]